ncbi:hypothetical protein IID62_04480 [candidate division KSB1 bacterium]|nr:hypothetical protein [candidate division KSB1 bacterium]
MVESIKNLYNQSIGIRRGITIDAPYRIEPCQPVSLIFRFQNAHIIPFCIDSISVKIGQPGKIFGPVSVLKKPVEIQTSFWQSVFYVDIPENLNGVLKVEAVMKIHVNGKTKNIRVSPAAGGNKTLFVYRSRESLPSLSNYYFGDFHFYNCLSPDEKLTQKSLSESAGIARSMGLKFFTATGSSHNGSNGEDGENSNGSGSWEGFKKALETWNQKSDLVVLPGEKIVCKNYRNRDIDLLVLNYTESISGTANENEKHAHKKPEKRLKEVVGSVAAKALTFAVRPVKKLTFLDRWLLRKGIWGKPDLTLTGLTGMQVNNIPDYNSLSLEIRKWTEVLLKGKRTIIITGSDTQNSLNGGNGNRVSSNSGGSPRVSQKARNGILCKQPATAAKIIASLERGNSVITNGPLMDFTVKNESGGKSLLGGEIEGSSFVVKYKAVSTPEYGPLLNLKIFAGDIKAGVEELIYTANYDNDRFSVDGKFNFEPRSNQGYLRGELRSGKIDDKEITSYCLTNPVWIRSSIYK